MDSAQILALLRHVPGVFNKLSDANLKDGAAAQIQQHLANSVPGGPNAPPPTLTSPNDSPFGDDPHDPEYMQEPPEAPNSPTPGSRRRRPDVNTEEWIRHRKDNHKEVERRRRSNINDGIAELSRIVPNGVGEKAKGAVLARACQYIHQLKDNEARNIEKWTLEKLLMDQAMGDLQVQLEELRKAYEEQRAAREAAEAQLKALERIIDENGKAIEAPDANGEEGSRKRARAD